jgi:hypothetical protein
MQAVAGMAACSIAFRNAVFKVVPLALIRPVFEAALKVAEGDASSLAARRVEAVKKLMAEYGVTKEKVFASVGVKTLDDIGLPELQMLIGIYNSLRDGEAKPADIFEPQPDATATPKTGAGLKEVEKPVAAAAPAQAPATPAPAADDAKLVKLAVGILEGLALDKGLTSSKLYDLAAADGSARVTDLKQIPLVKLEAMAKEILAT